MTGLPTGWATITIGEASGVGGLSTDGDWIESKDQDSTGSVRLIQLQDIGDGTFVNKSSRFLTEEKAEELNCTFLSPGDVLIARMPDPLGRACRFPDIGRQSVTAVDVHVWRKGEHGVDSDFLVYCVNSPEIRQSLQEQASGTTRQRVSGGRLKAQEIPLPPLPEQRRIVRKLDTLSARTTAARTHLTAIEKLVERYKLAVLRSAYAGNLTADFREDSALEPVSALLKRTPPPQQGRGGRQATTEVKAGQGGISVNIPEVNLPEKWGWVSLLRIARQETGHTPSRSRDDWWGGDVCWMSIPDANLHHGRVIFDTIQKTNEQGLANSSARLLPAGTVVLSRTASVGYICIMGREMATSQDFATWTCTDALLPEYLMYALLSEGEDIKKFGKGSTHTTIYFPEIRAFHIKLAPLDEQREIVRRIETAFAKIDRLATEAAKALKLLGLLDQRILAKAFVGELVPQDPTDEPAEVLLARIREARAATPKARRDRKARA